MPGYQPLQSAQPALWADAAADWMDLGKKVYLQAENINKDIGDPLKDGWTGAAANTAKGRIDQSVRGLEAAKVEVEAIGQILQGLSEGIAMTQRMLNEGLELAARAGIEINPDGTVDGLEHGGDSALVNEALELVKQAVDKASTIDHEAAQWLRRAAGRTWVDTPFTLDGAYDTDGNVGSRIELDLLRDSIPTGPPDVVAAWWAGLSPYEQEKFKLAAADKIGTIKGIPADVQTELAGTDGLNRVKLVQYAMDNWANGGDDIYSNNCANFVSDGLAHAGMNEKWTFGGRKDTEHDWYRQPLGRILDKYTRSYSWSSAEGLHDFLSHNNGTDNVPLSQARPGDVIFWQDPKEGIHHAAVVTGVLNGHVYYSQHSDPAQNADWDIRRTFYDEVGNPQTPIIVRPNQT
jgi:Putative amidase domain